MLSTVQNARSMYKQEGFNYFASYSDTFHTIPRHSTQQQILTVPITYIFRLHILSTYVTYKAFILMYIIGTILLTDVLREFLGNMSVNTMIM